MQANNHASKQESMKARKPIIKKASREQMKKKSKHERNQTRNQTS